MAGLLLLSPHVHLRSMKRSRGGMSLQAVRVRSAKVMSDRYLLLIRSTFYIGTHAYAPFCYIDTHTQRSNMPKAIISPSVLASDFGQLSAECKRMMDGGAEWLHMGTCSASHRQISGNVLTMAYRCHGWVTQIAQYTGTYTY